MFVSERKHLMYTDLRHFSEIPHLNLANYMQAEAPVGNTVMGPSVSVDQLTVQKTQTIRVFFTTTTATFFDPAWTLLLPLFFLVVFVFVFRAGKLVFHTAPLRGG